MSEDGPLRPPRMEHAPPAQHAASVRGCAPAPVWYLRFEVGLCAWALNMCALAWWAGWESSCLLMAWGPLLGSSKPLSVSSTWFPPACCVCAGRCCRPTRAWGDEEGGECSCRVPHQWARVPHAAPHATPPLPPLPCHPSPAGAERCEAHVRMWRQKEDGDEGCSLCEGGVYLVTDLLPADKQSSKGGPLELCPTKATA